MKKNTIHYANNFTNIIFCLYKHIVFAIIDYSLFLKNAKPVR